MIALLWTSLSTEARDSELCHVFIDGANGTDSRGCLCANSTLEPCQTLSYVAKNLNCTKAEVTLLSESLELAVPVDFKHFEWLLVHSGINHSTIFCSGTNAGIAFVDVHNLTIHSLELQRCGAGRNSTSVDTKTNKTDLVSVAVYILSGMDIHDVNITSSNGRGLVIYDTNGVSIKNCVFSDNRA